MKGAAKNTLSDLGQSTVNGLTSASSTLSGLM